MALIRFYFRSPTYLASPLLSSDHEALLGAFPSDNGDIDENLSIC